MYRAQSTNMDNWFERFLNRLRGLAITDEDTTDDSNQNLAEAIRVTDIDLFIEENGKQHHTLQYELMKREKDPAFVVRRGQTFSIVITTNRPYNPDSDGMSFIFTASDVLKHNYGQGTLGLAALLTQPNKDLQWYAYLEEQKDTKIRVQITTPPDCIVGQWSMEIDTVWDQKLYASYYSPVRFFILFNPWCEQDQVFLDSEEQRYEYVLESSGLIWQGTAKCLRCIPWNYGQFERDILDCAFYIISRVGKCPATSRSDPIKVARALSAAITSPADQNGIICGNWGIDFGKFTPPSQWMGSAKILQHYYKTKRPVRYGQCWVFAGIINTVCRTIGIPARIVTSFSYAYNTQCSLSVDHFVDETGKILRELGNNSVWSFHVWNELFMSRPDLASKYDGWQVIDATPQEISDEMNRFGPVPVQAVRDGELKRPYDSELLFSEINADKIFWKYMGPSKPLKMLRRDVNSIGLYISTKAVGRMEREDVTYQYKDSEKTLDERETIIATLRSAPNSFSRYYLNQEFTDVSFEFDLRHGIKIGEPINIKLVMKNHSAEKEYRVKVILRAESTRYVGKAFDLIKQKDIDSMVKSGTIADAEMTISFDEYYKKLLKLHDNFVFKTTCLAKVLETDFEYYSYYDFQIDKPNIIISIRDEPTENTECNGVLTLENPLPVTIRRGIFYVEGNFMEDIVIRLKERIPPGTTASLDFTFTPPISGLFTLTAKFISRELGDVDGYLQFKIKPKQQQ